MKILSIHASHDGCITYVDNNEIVFHTQLDRYNRLKHFASPSKKVIDLIKSLDIDVLIFTGLPDNSIGEWKSFFLYVDRELVKKFKKIKIIYAEKTHHLFHAYCALTWKKNIENILVMDGAGAFISEEEQEQEQESIYHFNKGTLNHIKTTSLDIGQDYERECFDIYQGCYCEGKLLALSLHDTKANAVQSTFEKKYHNYIKENNLTENLLITGGTAQNVKNNSLLLDNFSNVFADPFNGDFGISLGAINFYLNNSLKVDNVYLGIPQKLNLEIFRGHKIISVSPDEVAKILINDPIAIFQSRSEQGQRGLGNRSILMNANHDEAANKMNEIKKREWYRPFACTILHEESSHYFEMKIDESPFMMFLFKVKEDKKSLFKSGIAVDGTCRIQTLKHSFNPCFYNLLSSFFKITGFPFILNTSLNLPGEVLVEELYDLKELFDNSGLKYVYFPEINKLIIK